MELDCLSLRDCGDPPWSVSHTLAASTAPASCEVLIVGGGITGLSAAMALAARGVEVAVIDRRLGDGATLRSGGIILGETLIGAYAPFQGCEQALRDWIESEKVACDAVWSSCLELSRNVEVSRPPNGWFDHGELRVVGEVPGGVLDPGKLLGGLIAAAGRAGARLINGVAVRSIAAASQSVSVGTRDTLISARQVIMAVDAVSRRQDFDPWQSRTFTVALQTAARPHLASAIGLSGPFYTRETPLLWGRPLADGSLLFGRELIEWPGWSPPADWRQRFTASVERLAARVRGLHPELRDVGIERAWSGPTARTIAGVPTLVEDPDVPGVIWAGGYGGHGLAQAFTLGRAAADRVAGERT